jgi:hypothetical protein
LILNVAYHIYQNIFMASVPDVQADPFRFFLSVTASHFAEFIDSGGQPLPNATVDLHAKI